MKAAVFVGASSALLLAVLGSFAGPVFASHESSAQGSSQSASASSSAMATSLAPIPPPAPELMPPVRRPHATTSHPPLLLRDAADRPVLESQQPISTKATCGRCHDVDWIVRHSNHGDLEQHSARAQQQPALRLGGRAGFELDCFACHLSNPSAEGRVVAMRAARFDQVATATLINTGVVERVGDGFRYVPTAFLADGKVRAETIGLGPPSTRACGQCHGAVYDERAPLTVRDNPFTVRLLTDQEGALFAAQRISDSGLSIAGKDALHRPWDVHAERLLSCQNCHFTPNHPALAEGESQRPEHLRYQPRRTDFADYLQRPDHMLATGTKMRRCDACHDAPKAHRWLVRAERHLDALACESCHIPRSYGPALREIDWTMPVAPNVPRRLHRGIYGIPSDPNAFTEGFEPLLLPRRMPSGKTQLAPFNPVTTWQWVTDDGGPVAASVLTQAFFTSDGTHHPDLVRALDRNGDGRLAEDELSLDEEAKVQAARARLAVVGVRASIRGLTETHAMHHGVAPGRFALRRCDACHSERSRAGAVLSLSERPPFGAQSSLRSDLEGTFMGIVERAPSGRLTLRSATEATGVYVFGASSVPWIDRVGLASVLGALAMALLHGGLRAGSKKSRKS